MQSSTLELEPTTDAATPLCVEQTDLATLIKHREWVYADTPLAVVYRHFESREQDYFAVKEGEHVVGLCSRGRVGFLMGHQFGFAIYRDQPVGRHMVERPLVFSHGTPVCEVLDKALNRSGNDFYEDVLLVDETGEFMGVITVPTLVQVQSALVAEKFHSQEVLHNKMMTISRQAGMAEIAIGVLHNVGNVLTSVNVSATIASDLVRQSKLSSLEKGMAMMETHRADLGAYLASDPKGKLLLDLLFQLTTRIRAEQTEQLKELASLLNHIGHIKSIVSMQQSYARVSGVMEPLSAADLIEDALQMNATAFARHGVRVCREFEAVPRVTADKHKILQILINLLRNGKQAMAQCEGRDKRLVVGLGLHNGGDRIRIKVQDNGVGIAPENLDRIFVHGFTTKKDGHGFGLHSSALAAREMGGSLQVHSDGPGCGATFTLDLPIAQTRGGR